MTRDEARRVVADIDRKPSMWSSGPDLLLAHVVRNIDDGATDLRLLLRQCRSVEEASQLREIIAARILKLEAVEADARHLADALSGASR